MARKHLIVPTQYFEPETFQINHLVSLFLAKGWFVTVIAPDPSYPSESVLKGCTSPSLRHRRLRICRFPIIKRDGSLFAAAINSIIFAVSGSFFAIYFSLRHPKAHIFAVQYSPFTCIVPAFVAVSMLNRRASLWIFTQFALPFLLIFAVLYGILEKTKILGDGKHQINAIVSFVVGLIFVSAVHPKEIVGNLILFLTVALVVVFVALYSGDLLKGK